MRTATEVEMLLAELDSYVADELEDQDLDFKRWDPTSRDKAVKTIVDMAVCMANGGVAQSYLACQTAFMDVTGRF